MSTPYNIPTIIGIADVCQYLAQNAISKSALFKKPPFTPLLPEIIYVENDSLKYIYANNLSGNNAELDAVANYVFSLCVYTLQAYNIYSSGNGGTIAPITPGTIMPLPYDFIVSGSSFIANGVSSITITLFIGYNIEFVRNAVPQYTTDDGSGLYYSWDRATGLFTISVAASGDGNPGSEHFRISAV
ncbi:MAG: hypothetical protein V4538_15295 [Bacteroidota bacterium]